MNVFLVPVAADRYALYSEEREDHVPAPVEGGGFVQRAAQHFQSQLDAAERRGSASDPPDGQASWISRLKTRSLRWIAESIAEQRLLWQLRGRAAAVLHHPDDLTESPARELLQRSLRRDWEHHRFWLVVDSLCGLASLMLVLIPGPNVIGYYFLFRIAGHYLSLRGARQGLSKTTWTFVASPPLTALRSVVHAPSVVRADIVGEVATTLRLENLGPFFDRCAQ
jgi:hypothetical protein